MIDCFGEYHQYPWYMMAETIVMMTIMLMMSVTIVLMNRWCLFTPSSSTLPLPSLHMLLGIAYNIVSMSCFKLVSASRWRTYCRLSNRMARTLSGANAEATATMAQQISVVIKDQKGAGRVAQTTWTPSRDSRLILIEVCGTCEYSTSASKCRPHRSSRSRWSRDRDDFS